MARGWRLNSSMRQVRSISVGSTTSTQTRTSPRPTKVEISDESISLPSPVVYARTSITLPPRRPRYRTASASGVCPHRTAHLLLAVLDQPRERLEDHVGRFEQVADAAVDVGLELGVVGPQAVEHDREL